MQLRVMALLSLLCVVCCKKPTKDTSVSTDSQELSLTDDGESTSGFPIEFTNYTSSDADPMLKAGEKLDLPIPDLPLSQPLVDLYGLVPLPISYSLQKELLDQKAVFLFFAEKGLVWNINAKPEIFKKEGCHPFALIRQGSTGAIVAFVVDGVPHIEDAIDTLYNAVNIVSAGNLCVNGDGYLTKVNNESHLDLLGTSNQNFAQYLYDQNLEDSQSKLQLAGIMSSVSSAASAAANVVERIKTFAGQVKLGYKLSKNDPAAVQTFFAKTPSAAKKYSASKGATSYAPNAQGVIESSGRIVDNPAYAANHLQMDSTAYAKFTSDLTDDFAKVDFEKLIGTGPKGDRTPGSPVPGKGGTLSFLAESANPIFTLTLQDGREIVVKKVSKDDPDFANEIRTLHEFGDSPGYVQYHGYLSSGDSHFILMEKLKGDFASQVAKDPQRDKAFGERRDGFYKGSDQILGALEHMRKAGNVHGDVKPENMGVTAGGDLVLLDFGSVQRYSDAEMKNAANLDKLKVSPLYRPPEKAPDVTVDMEVLTNKLFDNSKGTSEFLNFLWNDTNTYKNLSEKEKKAVQERVEKNWAAIVYSPEKLSKKDKRLGILFHNQYTNQQETMERERLEAAEVAKMISSPSAYDLGKVDVTGAGHFLYLNMTKKPLYDACEPCFGMQTPYFPEINKYFDEQILKASTQEEKDLLALIKSTFALPSERPSMTELRSQLSSVSTKYAPKAQ